MTKILEIESCGMYPHLKTPGTCSETRRRVKKLGAIPRWCPLESLRSHNRTTIRAALRRPGTQRRVHAIEAERKRIRHQQVLRGQAICTALDLGGYVGPPAHAADVREGLRINRNNHHATIRKRPIP